MSEASEAVRDTAEKIAWYAMGQRDAWNAIRLRMDAIIAELERKPKEEDKEEQ